MMYWQKTNDLLDEDEALELSKRVSWLPFLLIRYEIKSPVSSLKAYWGYGWAVNGTKNRSVR